MPISNSEVTVGTLREWLENMEASDEDEIYISTDFGVMGIFSIRKHEVKDEEGDESTYVLING